MRTSFFRRQNFQRHATMLPLQRYFSSFSSSSSMLTYEGARCEDTCGGSGVSDTVGPNNNSNSTRYRRNSHLSSTNSRRHYGLIDVNVDDGSVVLFIDAYSPSEFHQLLTLLSSCCPSCNERHTVSSRINTGCLNNGSTASSPGLKKNGYRKIRQLQIHRTRWNLQRTKGDIKKLFETLLSSSWLARSLSSIELSGFAGTRNQSLEARSHQQDNFSNNFGRDTVFDHELSGLSGLLGRHFGLERFELRLRSGTIPDSLLLTLSKIPMLQEVHLFLCDSAPVAKLIPVETNTTTTKAVAGANLSSCSRLKHLNIYDNRWNEPFQLRHDHGVELVERLRNNTSLKSFLLQPGLDDACVGKMVNLVIRGNSALSTLQFALHHNSRYAEHNTATSQYTAADTFAIEVAGALMANQSLSTLAIHDPRWIFHTKTTSVGKKAILAMLANNYTLEHLSLCGHPTSTSNSRRRAYPDMIGHITTTTSTKDDADADEENFQAQVHFFLRLNRLSRGRLLSANNAPTRKWIDILGENREDLDYLFYMLSQNPSICDVQSRG